MKSPFYRLRDSFVLGIEFELSRHIHKKNENPETKDIATYSLEEVEVDEDVIMIRFLFWGFDISIDRRIK